MSGTEQVIILGVMSGLLVVLGFCAGVFWWRQRAVGAIRTLQLSRDLVERLRVVEAWITRLEAQERSRTPGALVQARKGGSLAVETVEVPEAPPCPTAPDQALDTSWPGCVETLISIPDLAEQGRSSPTVAEDLAHRFGAIWLLADEGQNPAAIARMTGQPVGMVELALGLRRKLAMVADCGTHER